MKKKNLAALLMAGAMCFSLLAGCSGGSETGGTGTILYTMAGGMIVLFGAGFLYKKKFRERRA